MNFKAIVLGKEYIISNIYNFLQIDGDEEGDIDYEDETGAKEKEEDASVNQHSE